MRQFREVSVGPLHPLVGRKKPSNGHDPEHSPPVGVPRVERRVPPASSSWLDPSNFSPASSLSAGTRGFKTRPVSSIRPYSCSHLIAAAAAFHPLRGAPTSRKSPRIHL